MKHRFIKTLLTLTICTAVSLSPLPAEAVGCSAGDASLSIAQRLAGQLGAGSCQSQVLSGSGSCPGSPMCSQVLDLNTLRSLCDGLGIDCGSVCGRCYSTAARAAAGTTAGTKTAGCTNPAAGCSTNTNAYTAADTVTGEALSANAGSTQDAAGKEICTDSEKCSTPAFTAKTAVTAITDTASQRSTEDTENSSCNTPADASTTPAVTTGTTQDRTKSGTAADTAYADAAAGSSNTNCYGNASSGSNASNCYGNASAGSSNSSCYSSSGKVIVKQVTSVAELEEILGQYSSGCANNRKTQTTGNNGQKTDAGTSAKPDTTTPSGNTGTNTGNGAQTDKNAPNKDTTPAAAAKPETETQNNNTKTDTNTKNTDTKTDAASGSQSGSIISSVDYVNRIVELVNQERAKQGLSPVTLDTKLTQAAQVRAGEIITSFSHTRPNGSSFSTVLKESGISYSGCGENIAWGQKSPEAVMEAWMNSEGHRANILNKNYKYIGVGYTQSSNGTKYWSQLFTY